MSQVGVFLIGVGCGGMLASLLIILLVIAGVK